MTQTNTTPERVGFIGAKGGVGTSVAAVRYALERAERGAHVSLIGQNGDEILVILGLPVAATEPIPFGKGSIQVNHPLTNDTTVVVIDALDTNYVVDRWVIVARNDYLSARRLLSLIERLGTTPREVLVILEAERSLNESDMRAIVTPTRVVGEPWSATVARTIDAGLTLTRPLRRKEVVAPIN